MNQNYKTIFSRIRQCFVVVSELTKSHGKGSRASRVLCTVLLGACLAGVGQPAAWGATATNASVNVTEGSSDASSAWGINTSATGASSTAWGYGSGDYPVTATGEAATAFGWGTKAEGNHSTAFGQITAAYGGASTAFGWNSKAFGTASTAFGNSSETYGYGTTAFGSDSRTFGKYSTAFGEYTMAAGEDSTAFGLRTQAGRLLYGTTEALIRRYKDGDEYKYKIVDADNTSTTLKDGFASYDDAYGDSGLTREGDQATAFGRDTKATGASSTAWGNSTTASGNGSTAWGGYTVTSEVHQGGTASGLGATAFGSGTWAEGTLSTAWGSGTGASGENATAWGYMTQATAAQATSWGGNTSAGAAHATAWGNSTTASGEASTAFGIDTTASGMAATAFGYVGTKESGYDAPSIKATEIGTTAYGYATLGGTISAEGGGSTAFGSATMGGKISAGTGGGANDKEGATAFGRAYGEKGQILATEMGATAFGAASDGSIKAEAWGATAFGRTYDDGSISASGRGATAFGYAEKDGSISAEAEGATAFGYAFGEDSKITASGIGSTAFGHSSTAKAENSLAALGGIVDTAATNSAAIGKGAKAVVADTVALGSGSVASREAGADDAYLKGGNSGNAWVSTHNAIAVGDDDTVTRQITGVAAGSKDTDAVNVAQLKEFASNAGSAITFKGDTGSSIEKPKEVNIIGGITDESALSTEDNIGVIATKNSNGGELKVRLAKDINLGKDGSVTTGNTRMDGNGLTIKGGPSVTQSGIDAGGKKITNVANGTDAKDAVNVSQLNDATQQQENNFRRLMHKDAQLERKIHRTGAHAAALAALHPLDFDEDHKLTASAGVGQYHGSNAVAAGVFYRPDENKMFSLGVSLNESDSMVNAGFSYRFGTGSGNKTSPNNLHEMRRQISTLSEENRQLSAQLNSSETKLAAESERSARLEAEINKIKKLLKLK